MKYILLISSLFIFKISSSQVENFDILTKHIHISKIKSITRFSESKGFPNGEKEFNHFFDKEGKLISTEEFDYPMGPGNPIVMRQEIKYNSESKKTATYIKAPDGSIAIDTLFYGNNGDLIKKQRLVNNQIVRTWDYSNKKKEESLDQKFDNKGRLVKSTKSDGTFTTYKYDRFGNLTQELRFQAGKEYEKYLFEYDKENLLTKMQVYLLYIRDVAKDPLRYYFEYEFFE